MANIFLERFPVRKKNITKFLSKNITKLSKERIIYLIEENDYKDIELITQISDEDMKYSILYKLYYDNYRGNVDAIAFIRIVNTLDENKRYSFYKNFTFYDPEAIKEAMSGLSEYTQYALVRDLFEHSSSLGHSQSTDYINCLSEENKKHIIGRYIDKLSYFDRPKLLAQIDDDDFKISILKTSKDSKKDIIESIKDTKMLIELAKDYKSNGIDRYSLIHIFEKLSDEEKEQLFDSIYLELSEYAFIDILETFSEEYREKMIDKYLSHISSFKNEFEYDNNYAIDSLIRSFSGNKRVDLIKKYGHLISNRVKDEIIKNLPYDDLTKYIDSNINSFKPLDFNRFLFNMKYDDAIKYLKKYKNYIDFSYGFFLITKSDEEVINIINFINDVCKDPYTYYSLINDIRDKELKKEYIIKYLDIIDDHLLSIMKNFDESEKVEFFIQHKDLISAENFTFMINELNSFTEQEMLIKQKKLVLNKLYVKNEMFNIPEFKEEYIRNIKSSGYSYSLSDEEYIRIGQFLTKTNDEIFMTLNPILLSDQFLQMLDDGTGNYPSLRVIGRFPEIQNSIIKLSSMSIPFCKALLKSAVTTNVDYTQVLYIMLTQVLFKKGNPTNIMNLISTSEISPEKIDLYVKKLMLISSNLFTTFDELTLDILDNLDAKIEEKSNSILSTSSDIDKIREAVLLKRYGINFYTAYEMLRLYSVDLTTVETYGDPLYEMIKVVLSDIKTIMNEEDINLLKIMGLQAKKNVDYDSLISLSAYCRKMYGNQLSKSLSSTSKMKKLDDTGSSCKQDIVLAFDDDTKFDFNILLTSLGAYSNYERPSNYKDDWLRPKLASHGFCASLISNQMMGTARIKYACLGFNSIPPELLLLAGPYDLDSKAAISSFDYTMSWAYDRCRFLSPKTMIDRTRHTHNEIVIERLINEGKLMPDYVVFMTEEYDKDRITKIEKLTEEDLELIESYLKAQQNKDKIKEKVIELLIKKEIIEKGQSDEEIERIILECQTWSNSLQASNDFGIPIVVVERKKIREHEVQVVNEMLNDFKRTHNPTTLVELLVRFENNRAGSRDYYVCEGFEPKDVERIFNIVFNEIDILIESGDIDQAKQCLSALSSWVDDEDAKFERGGRKGALGFETEDFKNRVSAYDQKVNKSEKLVDNEQNVMGVDVVDYGKEIDGIITLDIFDEKKSDSEQYSIHEVEDMYKVVSDLVKLSILDGKRRETYNPNSKSHGERHSQDTILFAALVGQQRLFGNNKGELLKLALESSKFHDCGRISDYDPNHAETGANKAFDILKESGYYSPIELSIIYSAIYNHEFTGDSSDMEVFNRELKTSSSKVFKDCFMSIVKGVHPTQKVEYTEEEYQTALKDPKNIKDFDISNLDEDVHQVVTLVRDADALDRTRFLDSSSASLDPKYLTPEARKFISFSHSLAEYHATIDLEKLKREGKIDDELIKRIKTNPSEVIGRDVRYTIKTNKELIKFIRDNKLYKEGVGKTNE